MVLTECKSELHSNHNKTIDFFSVKIFASCTWFTNENNYCLCLPANLLIYWCVDVPSVPVQIRNWFFFSIFYKKKLFCHHRPNNSAVQYGVKNFRSLQLLENVSLRKKNCGYTFSLCSRNWNTHTPVLLSKK